MRPFARHYDSIYGDKDYDADLRVLRTLVGTAADRYCRVLEIGAGTGNHTRRLAQLAKRLVSLEIDKDFLEVAAAKVATCPNVKLVSTPVEELPCSCFDGVASFFNVLNYLPHDRLPRFIDAIGERLDSGGWFVGDLWNGDAVIGDPPKPETRHKQGSCVQIRQSISPDFYPDDRRVVLNYDVRVQGPGVDDHFQESLPMHLPGIERLHALFRSAGFCEPVFYERRRFPTAATATSWQVWLYATKI